MSKPIDLTDGSFTQVVNDNTLILVDFWAPWCGPCRMVGPILEEIASEMNGKVTIGKINVDENTSSATQFGIRSIPTMLLFKNGEMVERITGAIPKQMIQQHIEKHLN